MSKPALLIVDDDPQIRKGIARTLGKTEYRIIEASSGEEAKVLLKKNIVGVLISDQQMGAISGLELLRWSRINHPNTARVMLTANSSVGLMQEAINSGEVFRYISKPWDNVKLRHLVEVSFAHYEQSIIQSGQEKRSDEQALAFQDLDKRFQLALKDLLENRETLKTSRIEAIKALAKAVDAKDPYTHGHMERVSDMCLMVAQEMHLQANERDAIQMAGMLHDVGKIGVPDNILLNTGALSATDLTAMKLHPEMGGKIVGPIKFSWNLRELIEAHHERYDGSGYPRDLKGDEIPLGARIISLVDAYDAMATARRYRPALSNDFIAKEIRRFVGSQFDPAVSKIFLNLMASGKINLPRSGDNALEAGAEDPKKLLTLEDNHV